MQFRRVLIVDDNCYNLFVLEILLKKLNDSFLISKAQNGVEAISVFKDVMLEQEKRNKRVSSNQSNLVKIR